MNRGSESERQRLQTQALIFDLDGTLWDTAQACAVGWNRALKQLQLPYPEASPADLGRCMGKTAAEIREMFFPDLPLEESVRILAECFQEELAAIRELGGNLYPGVAETLPKLARLYPLYLVSNCDPPYLDAFRQTTTLSRFFFDMECHGATGLSKGENICLIMERNQLDSAVYIGDTHGDHEGAEMAAIPFIHARYGFGEAPACEHRIAHFAELLELLEPRKNEK